MENISFLFKDECSFVSLRDVERAMQVMVWFCNRLETLGRLINKVLIEQRWEAGLDADEYCCNEVINYLYFFKCTTNKETTKRK